MQTIHEESVFTSLQQQNPLAVEEHIQLCAPFSQNTRTHVGLCRGVGASGVRCKQFRSDALARILTIGF